MATTVADERTSVDSDGARLEHAWEKPPGLVGWLSAVSSSQIGRRYLVTAFAFFVLGGLLALAMRSQLAVPENDLLSHQRYNEFFTMHGTTMMFLFAVPVAEGLAVYFIPLLLGTRDLPFPRLNAFGYWCFLFGGALLYSSFLFNQAPDAGWFAYPPLSGKEFSPGMRMDFWALGITLTEIAGISFAIEIITAFFRLRAPGMTLNRVPLFAWAILATAFMILFSFPSVIAAGLMLEAGRAFLLPAFDPLRGGDPLLWQHLFWIFGHPEVYIIFLPGAGLIDTLLPPMTRRPVIGYPVLASTLVATAVISFGVWVHHMFVTGLPDVSMSLFSAASMLVVIPTGIQMFIWLTTIWTGRPVLKTPFLFVIGFVVIFVLGGVTGAMVGLIPFDMQVHDTYFIVAHFHYVMIGGLVFPLIGGLYFWLPHITGKLLSERLGRWNFWVMFLGFNLAFFPMHNSGLLGMPRRVYTYPANIGWDTTNLLSTVGAFLFGAGLLLFFINVIRSIRRGETAPENPWGGAMLEWATPSPTPSFKFRSIPNVPGRYPLWDDPALSERVQAGREWLATANGDKRETLLTTPLDAEPEGVVLLPRPSIWPFLTALSLAVTMAGFIGPWYWVMILGAAGTVAGATGWLWPSPALESEPGSVREGLPVNPGGTRATTWWGFVLFLAALLAFYVYLLSSYFYLSKGKPSWPPPGAALPDLLLPALGLAVLLGAAAGLRLAVRSARRGGRALTGWLAGALVLLAGFLLLLGTHVASEVAGGLRPQETAYAAMVLTLLGGQAAVTTALLILSGVLFARSVRGHFGRERHLVVELAALFGYFTAAQWLTTFLVIYVAPLVW